MSMMGITPRDQLLGKWQGDGSLEVPLSDPVVHSFNKHLLSSQSVPGSSLGAVDF